MKTTYLIAFLIFALQVKGQIIYGTTRLGGQAGKGVLFSYQSRMDTKLNITSLLQTLGRFPKEDCSKEQVQLSMD
jgi:hypothetical protein